LALSLVIKPRKSTMRLDSGPQQVGPIRRRSGELVRTVESMLIDATDELLIQEYVSGEGAGVFGCTSTGGRDSFSLIAAFAKAT